MSDKIGPTFPFPGFGDAPGPQALEAAGRRAFTAFNQAGTLASQMAQAVLARQQRLLDTEFRRFLEGFQAPAALPANPQALETQARALHESIATTTSEMQAITEILLNGNRQMLELWMGWFKTEQDNAGAAAKPANGKIKLGL